MILKLFYHSDMLTIIHGIAVRHLNVRALYDDLNVVCPPLTQVLESLPPGECAEVAGPLRADESQ